MTYFWLSLYQKHKDKWQVRPTSAIYVTSPVPVSIWVSDSSNAACGKNWVQHSQLWLFVSWKSFKTVICNFIEAGLQERMSWLSPKSSQWPNVYMSTQFGCSPVTITYSVQLIQCFFVKSKSPTPAPKRKLTASSSGGKGSKVHMRQWYGVEQCEIDRSNTYLYVQLVTCKSCHLQIYVQLVTCKSHRYLKLCPKMILDS